MGAGGNEIWTDLCAGRRIKAQFQDVGAHPWILERMNGIAQGIYNRPIADDRQIAPGAQRRRKTENGKWVIVLPSCPRLQSSGRGFAICPRCPACRTISTAVEASNDGARGCLEGSTQ